MRQNSVARNLTSANDYGDAQPVEPVDCSGTPWDIARAVCYLASDAAAWVTGAMLLVDGGVLVRA